MASRQGDPKQKTLITAKSLEKAAQRILAGERPPRIGKLSVNMLIADSFVGDFLEVEVQRAFPDAYDPDAEEEKMEAKQFQKEEAAREAAALAEEKWRLHEELNRQEPEPEKPIKVEIDPKLGW